MWSFAAALRYVFAHADGVAQTKPLANKRLQSGKTIDKCPCIGQNASFGVRSGRLTTCLLDAIFAAQRPHSKDSFVRPISKSKKLADVCYDIRGPVLEKARKMEEEGHKIIKLNIGNLATFNFDPP